MIQATTSLFLPVLALSAAALAQAPPPQTDVIGEVVTEARVRTVVSWLADDERGGRDTPSPGLEAAATWLGERFAAAGLQQLREGSWFHDYTLPGLWLDSSTIEVEVSRKDGKEIEKFPLVPGDDVRLWRAADVTSGDEEPATVAQIEDPMLRRLLYAGAGRRPILIEVGVDHPFWQQAAGRRAVLGRQRAAARPVFLVRDGILPPPPVGDEPGWAATWAVPATEANELPLQNVVAMLPGSDKREEYVVVSAHYDHIGTGNPVGGDAINNGADDDASGTTAVVLIAEALAQMPAPRRSILFVCFSAEEKGLRGSRAFLEHPPVPREQIVANINIEMIGRPEEGKARQFWVTGRELSDFADIAGAAMRRRGVELVDFPMAQRLFAASDNYSFVRHGIVAHSISAGSLHQDYHRPSDEVGKLDIGHMTTVIRGLCEFVRDVAERETPPVWNEQGRKRIESAGKGRGR